MGAGLFPQVPSDAMKQLQLHHWRFRLDISKTFFMERVGRHQNRLSMEVLESPSLKAFKRCVDVALSLVVGLVIRCMLGLDVLKGLFQPK